MNRPWWILAVVLALAVGAVLGERDGKARADTAWGARIEKNRAESFKAGRDIERKQQEKVNEALLKQNEALAGIHARLAADIDRLRRRPERPADLPATPRADCAGANGAELGASHAVFLARFAALAARYDAALVACYTTLDALGDPS